MPLGIGEPFGGDRVEHTEHVAKAIIDIGFSHAIGQAAGCVLDLGAQLGPELGQLCSVECVFHLHINPG